MRGSAQVTFVAALVPAAVIFLLIMFLLPAVAPPAAAGADAAAPTSQEAPALVAYRFRSPSGEFERKITISTNGAIRSVTTRGDRAEDIATGQLSGKQQARLDEAIRLAAVADAPPAPSPAPAHPGTDQRGESGDPGHVIRFGGKIVALRTRDLPPPLAALCALVVQFARLQASPDVPPASSDDLAVGLTRIDASPAAAESARKEVAILAYVLNRSDHPVRVYLPGLVGPRIGGRIDQPGASDPIFENRVAPQFGPGDFVVLRPGEVIGRRHAGPTAGHHVLAYYVIYKPGREGEQEAIAQVLHADGRVTPPGG